MSGSAHVTTPRTKIFLKFADENFAVCLLALKELTRSGKSDLS